MPATASPVEVNLAELSKLVDAALERYLPSATTPPPRLHEAMRYSVFGGGKRLRPALALMSCEALGGTKANAMAAACSLEMIHTYSLIHDDLPSMDDDDFRRGRPSCHKAFDEATAILAGDALQACAFGTIAENVKDDALAAALVRELAEAAGSIGMVGGQVLDLAGSTKSTEESLEQIHLKKTAAMFVASAKMGALCGGASGAVLKRFGAYGRDLGLAFQIVDDILDVLGTARELGKTPGKDAEQNKATYPALLGIEKSRRRAELLIKRAVKSVASLGTRGRRLTDLAEFFLERTR